MALVTHSLSEKKHAKHWDRKSSSKKHAKHWDRESSSSKKPAKCPESNGAFPSTVQGKNGLWVLLNVVASPDSFKTGANKIPTPTEMRITGPLTSADGYEYNVNSSTSRTTIHRANCRSQECPVQIKIVRGNGFLGKYQRGHHNHLPTTGGNISSTGSRASMSAWPASHAASRNHSRSPTRAPPAKKRSAKSPNYELFSALKDYANGLEDYIREQGIDGDYNKWIPRSVLRAAMSVKDVCTTAQPVRIHFMWKGKTRLFLSHLITLCLATRTFQADHEIQLNHYPFDKKVCDCTIAGYEKCKWSGRNRERPCRRGDYNLPGVGSVWRELIEEYFNNAGNIRPNYSRHFPKRK